MSGRVILVGAGPGDPDLITVRGAAALGRAEVVVYDALSPPELLDLAPVAAERINVGKRGHDDPRRVQEEINAILIDHARQGRTVVRLKGGDPFVFGRGGEELSACVAAGVAFEVIPGVSSALAAPAFAGIPVTDRRYAASFAVVTGHKDPTQVSRELAWGEIARSVDTFIVLMGMRNLEEIVERVLSNGPPPNTPAAAIMWGSVPRQRVVEATLGELVKHVREAGLGAPAAIVVGNVVRLRKELRWYDDLPLLGLRVAVTRAATQSASLASALLGRGADPVLLPMIRTEPPRDWKPLDAALSEMSAFDTVIFTSQNGVQATAQRAARLGVAPSAFFRVACVGDQTAAAARAAGFVVAVTPEDRFDAQGLLETLRRQGDLAGQRILIAGAERGRDILPEGLREAGAEVESVAAYRTVPAEVDSVQLSERLCAGNLDVLTFASPSAVKAFYGSLDADARSAASRCIVAALGEATASALGARGVSPEVKPARATVEEWVEALARYVSERAPARPGGET